MMPEKLSITQIKAFTNDSIVVITATLINKLSQLLFFVLLLFFDMLLNLFKVYLKLFKFNNFN